MNRSPSVLSQLRTQPTDYDRYWVGNNAYHNKVINSKLYRKINTFSEDDIQYDNKRSHALLSDRLYKDIYHTLFRVKKECLDKLATLFYLSHIIFAPINSKRMWETLNQIRESKGTNVALTTVDYRQDLTWDTLSKYFKFKPQELILKIDQDVARFLRHSLEGIPGTVHDIWAEQIGRFIGGVNPKSAAVGSVFEAIMAESDRSEVHTDNLHSIMLVPHKGLRT